MPSFQPNIVEGDASAERRLLELELAPDQLIAVADTARKWGDDASPLMPLNAPGTLAYIFGVDELRRQVVGDGWEVDREFGIEGVINRRLGLRIVFQNVDRACDLMLKPHPRTAKGNGAQQLSGPTLFEHYGTEPGPLTAIKADGFTTYYLMVAEDGSVELSCPIVENGSFVAFVERIFVRRNGDDWEAEIISTDDATDEFDVIVSFKE